MTHEATTEPGTGVEALNGSRSDTARIVFERILRYGPRPRSELAAQLQLSGATLTRVTRELLDTGLLRVLPPVTRDRGRPQEPLDVDEHRARFVGVKVTSREVFAVVTTLRANPLEELTLPLKSSDPEHVVRAITSLMEAILAAHTGVAGIGVSIGGQVAADGAVLTSPMLGWTEPVALGARLTATLGRPVTVENDLIALLQGVHWFGIGRRYSSFVLLTIGAGVGVGVVHGGQVLQGHRHLLGQTETMPSAARDGRPAPITEIAGGPALLERARDAGLIGEDGDLEDLLAAHRAGREGAREIGGDVAHGVAITLAALVGILDPEAVMLGGEAIGLIDDSSPPFDDLLREHLVPEQRDVQLRRLPEDFDEWARGAAVTAIQHFAAGLG
ncbi:MAG: ROK family transcriptional regulator [Brachybacterium sp.]|nr:ROK family transcriptional regulator [Brachybacterium sp.]